MFIVHIAGNLGKDPETRFTASGLKVTTFTVAVNKKVKEKEETIWVRVTVWGDRFDKLVSYLKKGSGVIVSGKMNTPTSYVDKQGQTQISLEITAEMIEFNPFGRTDKPEGQVAQQASPYGSPAGSKQGYDQSPQSSPYQGDYGHQVMGGGQTDYSIDEDQIPF